MSEPIDILENELLQDEPELLQALLLDRTTRKNIFWATDSYTDLGEGYAWHDVITIEAITGSHGNLIIPRAMKSCDEQARRSRQMAEVFTPSWIVAKMNDVVDEEWVNDPKGQSNNEQAWQRYVLATCLEVTCGEAPFLTSRYDTVTGEAIPISRHIGVLDRKLRMVNEHSSDAEWTHWALLALGSVYGYEWQGDNLMLAREALLATFCEYHEQRFGTKPAKALLLRVAEIISWNIWQMDGLKAVVPCSCHEQQHTEVDLFGGNTTTIAPCPGCDRGDILLHNGERCRLRRWIPADGEQPDHFECLYLDFVTKKIKTHYKTKWPMKFDFVIGNPPYQQESNGANENDKPLYHYFIDAAVSASDRVELITPARFLFNAGDTPAAWNEKMLQDSHFKVLSYEMNSAKIFPSTSINGGIAVTYYNKDKDFGAIGFFTAFPELNSILHKVSSLSTQSLADTVTNRGIYKYSELAYKEQATEMNKTADSRIAPSSFDRMPSLFTIDKPSDGHEYIKIYGIIGGQRTYRWFRKDYVNYVENLDKYKVVVSKADGAAGTIGKPIPARIMGKPVLIEPDVGFTETFISIGSTNEEEAKAIFAYVKTKFARTMLSILKVTQNNAKPTWKYVPLQDFTSSSDIDWTKNVHEIDLQLYDKYGLTEEERNFIETHVKEMA